MLVITLISNITGDLNRSSPRREESSTKQFRSLVLVNYPTNLFYGHRPVLLINTSLSALRSASSSIWRRFPKTGRDCGHEINTHMHTLGLNSRRATQVYHLRVSQWRNITFMSFRVITFFHLHWL